MKKGFFVLRESDETCPPGATFSTESFYCDQCPYRNLDGEDDEDGEELEYEDSYWEEGNASGAAMWYYATREDMQEETGFEPFSEADYSAVEATGEISFEDEVDDDGFLDS